MSKALRSVFGGRKTSNISFETIGTKKYLLHDLPGAPICELYHWKEKSLTLVLRIVPTTIKHPQAGFVKSYQLEVIAGDYLTLDPNNDFEPEGVDWKLIYKDTGYREIWDKFDYYRKEIEKQEGISSIEGFVRDWSVIDGNVQLLLTKLNY